MAREKKTEAKDERQERWDALWDAYAKINPVKYAEKKAAGALKNIPENF